MTSTYIDLHNLSEISVDGIDVSNLNCDSIITTDLTISGNLTGLNTSTNSIFNYTYTPSTRTFALSLATQPGINYILITNSSGIFQSVLFTPLIYPLLSGSAPILYNNTTGIFSLDTTISQNETFTGLLTATSNASSTVSRSNLILCSTIGTSTYPIIFGSTISGYINIYSDSSNSLTYNIGTDTINCINGIFTGLLTATTGVNIPTGQTYKINNVPIVLLNALTTTPTTTITHIFVSPNLQSNINALSITDGLITNNTITLSKINTSSYSQVGSSLLLAQYGNLGSLNPTHIYTQSGNGMSNYFYSPGTSSTSIGSLVPTMVIGDEYINPGVLRIDSIDANKAFIHLLSNTLYIETNNGVGSIINIGKGSNTNTTIRNLTVTSNINCDGLSATQNVSSGISMTTGYINLNNSTSSITTATVGTFTTTSYINGTSSGVNFGNLDGVMTLSSNQATSNGVPFATIIQNHGGSTYIDNQTSATGLVPFIPYINIGTVTPNQVINIGNTTSDITYNNGNFLKYSKIRFTSFNVVAFSAVNTIWYAIRDTTVPANNLVLSYTGRLNEQIEISVRISGAGTGATNIYMYFDIHIGTQPAYGTTSTNPSIVTLNTPTTNQWGSWLFGGVSNQYQGIYFNSYYTFTSAGSKTFYPVFRVQTTNSTWSIGSATAGINTLGEMNIRTLF